MAYNSNLPTDDEYIAAGPADIRENFRALKEDQIVNAGTLAGLSAGNASGNIPKSNGTVNTNLNADRLDGYEASAFSLASHAHSAATTSSAGFMSAADKTKIDGVASGAEINQNAFSNVQVGSTTIQADSKIDTLEFVAGTNISLAPDATNDRVTINVNGTVENAATAAKAVKLTAPVTINGVSFDGSGSITVADSSKAPIQHASTGTTYGVATSSNYGHAMASSATPLVAGTASAGTDNGKFAREGHVHPAQTSVTGSSGSCTGNAATATSAAKLTTARTISLTGAVSGSVSFDGSGNVSIVTSNGTVGGAYDAGHSFGATGYQKLSNGLIVQWGHIQSVDCYSATITYPIAFPTMVVALTGVQLGANGADQFVNGWYVTSQTATQFILTNHSNGTNEYTWIAIGY